MTEDLVLGSELELLMTVGKVGGDPVTIGWELLLADPLPVLGIELGERPPC